MLRIKKKKKGKENPFPPMAAWMTNTDIWFQSRGSECLEEDKVIQCHYKVILV